jgi:hypothetical protein
MHHSSRSLDIPLTSQGITAVRSLTLLLIALLLQGCAFNLPRFERQLNSAQGVEGEVHGANADLGLYVFTYRNPKDFFEYLEISLIAPTPDLAAAMAQAKRHDRVRIKGELLDNRSPQPHVEVRAFEIVKAHASTPPIPSYDYAADIPNDLKNRNDALFLVHAVHAEGKILVVEYQDAVLPIYVLNPMHSKDLARNDVVRIHYELDTPPDRPLHLKLSESVAMPIEVVESVMALHGKDAAVEGSLVLFPTSPQVRFNVFAVLQPLQGGLRRQYTLANFESTEAFEQIRDKLQKAWDTSPDAVSGRNKLISKNVKVRVRGKFNEVDANQANVQILLAGPEAIEVIAQ